VGWRRILRRVGLGMLVLFGLLQLVPYGWRHPNPPVTQAAVWPSAEAEALFDAACADCHSNETDWPPYSYVAPMSWLVRSDVERGRDALNLSELDREQDELDDAADTIEDGSMPPWQYPLAHPDADLSAAEKRVLIAAFEQLEERYDD
jgi:mono/diheme cytochrome c family protein